MPDSIFDHGSSTGFVVPTFFSCSPNRDVAVSYAGGCCCELRADEEDVVFCPSHKSTLFEISAGALDGGASLAWVSQYPNEDEYCLAACSFYEVKGVRREHNVNVYELVVRSNCCGPTLEQLNEHRKTTVIDFGVEMFEEAHQLLSSTPVAARVSSEERSALHKLRAFFTDKYQAHSAEWFHSVVNYQEAINEVISISRSIHEESVLRILSWLQRQEDSLQHRNGCLVKVGGAYASPTVTWSTASKQCILKMHECALSNIRRCAAGKSGANDVRILQRKLARFLLKNGDDVGMPRSEVAKCWHKYASDAQSCEEHLEALAALEQELDLYRKEGAEVGAERTCVTLCAVVKVHTALGQIKEAEVTLENAHRQGDLLESKFHPAKGDVASARAVLHMRKGETKEALQSLEEALRIKMLYLPVHHDSVQEDLRHVRDLSSGVSFDKFKPPFRAIERIFWVVVHSSNPHRAASENDLSVKEVVDYMRGAKRMNASAAEWGCEVLRAALDSLPEIPNLMGKVSLQVALEAICSSMRNFCGNELVQAAGLRALLALSSHYPSNLFSSSATALHLDVVFSCMSAHCRHAGIQEAALRFINEMMNHSEPVALQELFANDVEALQSQSMPSFLFEARPSQGSPLSAARDAAAISIANILEKQVA
jgi:hypothetical protein